MKTILFLGFDNTQIEKWLQTPEIVKVVVFDNSYENRENFEQLYKQHVLDYNGVELTMYEGCISKDLEWYLKKGDVLVDDCIYAGNLELLNMCKKKTKFLTDNQKEIHDSCL